MLIWIILYCFVLVCTLEVCLVTFCIDYEHKHKTPVITSVMMAVLWPIFAAAYIWHALKWFALHMLAELVELC